MTMLTNKGMVVMPTSIVSMRMVVVLFDTSLLVVLTNIMTVFPDIMVVSICMVEVFSVSSINMHNGSVES